MTEFRDRQPTCPTHGPLGTPNSYSDSMDSLMYTCPMCSMEEGTYYIELNELTDDALVYAYLKTAKVDNSIELDGGNTRFDDLTPRLREEFEERGMDVPDTELTHQVTMMKDEALEFETQVPGIIQIGRADDDDYEMFTTPDEMGWVVQTTESEAELLTEKVGASAEPISPTQ